MAPRPDDGALFPRECSVAIIGAGAAGLAAARDLRRAGCADVVVLEASDRVGGRVRHGLMETGAGGPSVQVELGPEFVHGADNNAFLDVLNEMGCATHALAWPNYYYFGKECRLLGADEAHSLPELRQMHAAFDSLSELEPEATREQSLLAALVERGLSSRVLDMADAVYANDYGAELSSIGLREVIIEQRAWDHGEDYLVVEGRALSEAMAHLAQGSEVLLGFEAARVDWDVRAEDGSPRVRVTDRGGRRAVLARRVIVTVPLACLQRGAIAFAPELPLAKREALSRVRVGNALKVAVALSRRFWPADLWDVVCADCTFPELWLTPPADSLRQDREPGRPFVLVAFVSGERSARLGALGEAELVRLLLLQLDAMFGSAADRAPATSCCVGKLVCDWQQQPFAWGAYTHPTLDAAGAREAIGEPVGEPSGLVHFAGEATNLALNPCVHGAMRTGSDAALAVRASLSREARA